MMQFDWIDPSDYERTLSLLVIDEKIQIKYRRDRLIKHARLVFRINHRQHVTSVLCRIFTNEGDRRHLLV